MAIHASQPHATPANPSAVNRPAVAVIGCGRWGRNLIRNFHKLHHLHTVCDLNPQQLAEAAAPYPTTAQADSLDAVLSHPDIDAVVIATPSETHYAVARQALEAGKHVYVEKPMATSSEQSRELFTLATACDRILMVGHLLLYHPVVNRLRQLIDEGALGDISYVRSERLNYNPFRQDRSVMWDLAPHDVSMMSYLLNRDPERVVSARGHCTGTDGRMDVVHLELAFPGGATGHIHNSWVEPQKQVKLVVCGTQATAMLDDARETEKLLLFRPGTNGAPPIREFPEYLTMEPLKLECQHFINAIRQNRPPRTDGSNGYRVVSILEAADAMLTID